MRLIDADEMLKRIESWNTSDAMDKALYNFTLNRIVEQSTVDAVPVIRCKDCKFATITDGVYGRNPEVKYCDIWFPNEAEYMPINYYCASAERKEKCD